MKIITWLFKELVLLCLNIYFNEMKLEQLWSLRKQTVARLFEVSVTVNNEESADGCLVPLLADSFVVKTISCLMGEGEKERTGSEVGKRCLTKHQRVLDRSLHLVLLIWSKLSTS